MPHCKPNLAILKICVPHSYLVTFWNNILKSFIALHIIAWEYKRCINAILSLCGNLKPIKHFVAVREQWQNYFFVEKIEFREMRWKEIYTLFVIDHSFCQCVKNWKYGKILGHTAKVKLFWTRLFMRMSKYTIWTNMLNFFLTFFFKFS